MKIKKHSIYFSLFCDDCKLNLKTIKLDDYIRNSKCRQSYMNYDIQVTETTFHRISVTKGTNGILFVQTYNCTSWASNVNILVTFIRFSIVTGKWTVYMLYLFVVKTFNELPPVNRNEINKPTLSMTLTRTRRVQSYNLCKNFVSIVATSLLSSLTSIHREWNTFPHSSNASVLNSQKVLEVKYTKKSKNNLSLG